MIANIMLPYFFTEDRVAIEVDLRIRVVVIHALKIGDEVFIVSPCSSLSGTN